MVKRVQYQQSSAFDQGPLEHVVLGIDPGIAKTGYAVIKRTGPVIKMLLSGVIETKPIHKKARNSLRVTVDDQRRYREVFISIDKLYQTYKPHAVGVEAYLVGQQAASSAWKTAVVYGGVLSYAYAKQLWVMPFLPSDLKKRFVGKQSGSKLDVATGLYPLIQDMEYSISKLPKTKREHAVDAAGHAFLVLEEIDKTRELLGI